MKQNQLILWEEDYEQLTQELTIMKQNQLILFIFYHRLHEEKNVLTIIIRNGSLSYKKEKENNFQLCFTGLIKC